jgi:hypothetical protein
MNTYLGLSDENVKAAVAVAVINTLNAENKDKLLQEAIKGLFTPENRGNSWEKKSTFDRIFENEISNAARDIIRDEMAKPDNEFRVKISEAVKLAMQKALSREGEEFGVVTDAFTKAIVDLLMRRRD